MQDFNYALSFSTPKPCKPTSLLVESCCYSWLSVVGGVSGTAGTAGRRLDPPNRPGETGNPQAKLICRHGACQNVLALKSCPGLSQDFLKSYFFRQSGAECSYVKRAFLSDRLQQTHRGCSCKRPSSAESRQLSFKCGIAKGTKVSQRVPKHGRPPDPPRCRHGGRSGPNPSESPAFARAKGAWPD